LCGKGPDSSIVGLTSTERERMNSESNDN